MSSERVPPRPDAMHPVPPPPATVPSAGERPLATWRWWEAIGIYLLAIVIASFVALPVVALIDAENLANIASTAVAAVAIVAVVVVWLSRAHPTWRASVGFPAPGGWWREVRAGMGFGLLLYPGLVFGVGLLVSLVLQLFSGETVRTPEQVPSDLSTAALIITVLYAIVIAPIHEELFFRGVLFRGVRDSHGLGSGLISSALAFALIHYIEAPWQDTVLLMGVMFFNGIALAWYYERRGNVVANTVAHMVFNVIGLALILTVG